MSNCLVKARESIYSLLTNVVCSNLIKFLSLPRKLVLNVGDELGRMATISLNQSYDISFLTLFLSAEAVESSLR